MNDGAANEAAPLSASPIGRTLAGRYRIDALIGRGAMGSVYAGEHVLMHKPLALKILHPEHANSAELVARFEREATAAANINHPNVVAATDFGKLEDGTVYLALELVQGRSLRDEISKRALPVRRALHVARQVAAALGAAHARGIVHRDLKPENIVLVDKDGDPDFVKVLDFGIAKLTLTAASPLTKIGVVLGTRDYMAPEQGLGLEVDARADLYALGVVLYEMLCRHCPFDGQPQSAVLGLQLTKRPPSLKERAPELAIPDAVEALVMRLLAKERGDRPASAAIVTAEIEALIASLPNDATPSVAGTAPASATATEVAAAHQPTFLPGDPLPSFTFPPLEEEGQRLAGEVARALTVRGPSPAALPPAARGASLAERGKALLARGRGHAVALWQALRSGVLRAVDAAAAWLDRQRARWPATVQGALARFPSRTLVVGAVSAWVLALVIGVVAWVSAGGEEEAPVASRTSTPSALPAATPAPRVTPEEALTERSQTALASAEKEIEAGNFALALKSVEEALEANPALSENERVATILGEAARRRASSSTAFRLLSGPMGERGAAVIYDLAAHPKTPRDVRARAEGWLGSERFREVASPPLAVAGRLRSARGCKAKRDLLGEAAKTGDGRALDYLKILAVKGGCGRRGREDCFPCLRQDDTLERAIAELEARLATPQAAAR